MYDAGKIIIGLIIFVVLFTSPIWINLAGGASSAEPELEKAKGTDCVLPASEMKARHMDLLNQWRDDVVRRGERIHVAPNGRKYNMSLSKTCLDCHASKANFCDRCHSYLAVDPYCWSCHIFTEPKEVR